jgi:hypothetical protein
MVEPLFQTRSNCLSQHDQLNRSGTLYPHVSSPHHPTMGGPLGALIDTGLREFESNPVPLVTGYTSRGLRLQALQGFCQERHDPCGIVSCMGDVPTVVGRQLRLWPN